jgi:L-threonylcarbamoyladenylate synthase
METLRLTDANVEECAGLAAEILRAGGVVLYPTDTLYGLGADAFSDEAVAKVYAIKTRDEKKPIHCIVADIEMAEKYGELTPVARALAEKFFPGPLTLVLKKRKEVAGGITANMKTIGVRVPGNLFCAALARTFGGPITTTSANIAGMEAQGTVYGILQQLGEAQKHINLIVDAGALPHQQASSIVDVSGNTLNIIREGAIEKERILNAFHG